MTFQPTIGHTIPIRWYSPIPDRDAVLDQARRLVRSAAKAGFTDLTVLVDNEIVTQELSGIQPRRTPA